MMKHLYCGFIYLFVFVSCHRKEDVAPLQTQTAIVLDPLTRFLQTAVPDSVAAEFISGEFDGHFINCTRDSWPGSCNQYYKATDGGQLIRQDAQRNIQLNINFELTKLFTQAMPVSWPHSGQVPCETFKLALYNLAPDNSVKALFYGETMRPDLIKFTITSVSGNVIEGTFEGNIQQLGDRGNLYGRIVKVRNGKFRIKTTII